MMDAEERGQNQEQAEKPELQELPVASHIGVLTDTNKSLRRKIFDLYTIFEISRHLSSMLNVESLLDATLFTCIGQMGVSGAAIAVRDSTGDKLSHFHFKGLTLPKDVPMEFTPVGPLVRHLQRTGRPQIREELGDQVPEDSEDYAKLKALEAELIVPLLSKGDLLGILFLPRRLSGLPYQENDLEFVSILVNQLSVAIVNAHLYESEKQALLELRSAQKQLIESERLAALGRLAASIAHEVNNPLGIIKNYLTIISRNAEGLDEIKGHVGAVSEEVERIARIVKQLLDFYRPALERQAVLGVVDLLDSTLDLIDYKFKHAGIEIRRDYDDGLMRVTGSADKLKQVFLNLILNARDAMPEGGVLTVSAHKCNGAVQIDFADNGCGISKEELPRIFEPFFTTKKDSGMGLGLAVCHGIVTSHNGVISAAINTDGGATFTIKLPLEKENA